MLDDKRIYIYIHIYIENPMQFDVVQRSCDLIDINDTPPDINV